MKKKILSCLVAISVIVVGFNVATGITQANSSPKAFGVLIDNQTGDDITSIRLKAQVYEKNSGNAFEKDIWASFHKMEPGNYEEFIMSMKNSDEASVEKADLTMSVGADSDESYTVHDAIGIPVKAGKRTLIKLVGNKTSGYKAEFLEIL